MVPPETGLGERMKTLCQEGSTVKEYLEWEVVDTNPVLVDPVSLWKGP